MKRSVGVIANAEVTVGNVVRHFAYAFPSQKLVSLDSILIAIEKSLIENLELDEAFEFNLGEVINDDENKVSTVTFISGIKSISDVKVNLRAGLIFEKV